MSDRIFFTVQDFPLSSRTLLIYLEQVAPVGTRVIDTQTHAITMGPDLSSAFVEVLDPVIGTATIREEVLLPGNHSVVCTDFLPRVFGGYNSRPVQPMYALMRSGVAVIMQPYAPEAQWQDRLMVRFENNQFDDMMFGRRIRVPGTDRLSHAERMQLLDQNINGELVMESKEDKRTREEAFQQMLFQIIGGPGNIRWGREMVMPDAAARARPRRQLGIESSTEPESQNNN